MGRMGKRKIREFGIHYYSVLYLKWKPKRTNHIAHGNLLNVMSQPGWEESLENVYMYMYG